MIIYQITNNVNGKFYIGQTKKSVEERFKKHYYNAKYGSNTYLYKSMRKYGFENFSISVIEQTENLNEREVFWISELNPEYNMTSGGEGGDTSNSPNFKAGVKRYNLNKPKEAYATYGMRGKKLSQEAKDKISKSKWVPVILKELNIVQYLKHKSTILESLYVKD